jgi:hypothetical protein
MAVIQDLNSGMKLHLSRLGVTMKTLRLIVRISRTISVPSVWMGTLPWCLTTTAQPDVEPRPSGIVRTMRL